MATFTHKQRVAIKSLRLGVMPDGSKVCFDDWSQTGVVRATKRDQRPMGYVVVKFDGAGTLCIHEDQLRAAV
ncbi:MAG: hypothetical protein JWQ97_3549 [Phenylobacterium sp.]|nr:hypothetical protein [Phenylobacterium sp.]